MIIGFTGTPGSGKTYDAVRRILNSLSMDRVVYTNIDGMDAPECLEMIKKVCKLSSRALAKQLIYLQPDQTENFWDHISPGALIVLDEVDKIFDSREWQSEKNKKFSSWCSTHRRYGCDLFLITLDMARISASMRALFERCFVFRRENAGSTEEQKYICNFHDGDPTSKSFRRQRVCVYDPQIFRCYQSYAGISPAGIPCARV
jgi:zona occludens toxin (predicted ATPase)